MQDFLHKRDVLVDDQGGLSHTLKENAGHFLNRAVAKCGAKRPRKNTPQGRVLPWCSWPDLNRHAISGEGF